MQCSVQETKVFAKSLTGLKNEWKCQGPDVKDVDGTPYLRLNPVNGGLNSLIYENNDLAEQPGVRFPLTASHGLQALLSMRNERHAANVELLGPSLFETPSKRQKLSRTQRASQRDAPQSMTVNIEVNGVSCGVEMLCPAQGRDNLFVKCEPEMMAAVLQFIRNESFDMDHKHKEHSLPKGIYKRERPVNNDPERVVFVVKYIKPDGAIGFKANNSLEDAIAFQADPTINMGSDSDEEPPAGATSADTAHADSSGSADVAPTHEGD